MNASDKRQTVALGLGLFLDQNECFLPETVKVKRGFCGTNEEDSLQAEQILTLYKVERQKTIVALDRHGREICLHEKSRNKVHLLPLECQEYSTLRELLTDNSSCYLVVNELQSASPLTTQVVPGSKLMLSSDRGSIPNFIKCRVVGANASEEILLPLDVTGTFVPLLDDKDYSLSDVLATDDLPANILFVSASMRSQTNCASANSLARLGKVRLTRKTDIEMVFATFFHHESFIYIFPKALDISVSCASAETETNIEQCRQALETRKAHLGVLEELISDSFYFTAIPVRRFNLRSLQIPPKPLPRFLKAKNGKQSETDPYQNTERDCAELINCQNLERGHYKPLLGEIQERHYQRYEPGIKTEDTSSRESIKSTNSFSASVEVTAEGLCPNSEIAINETEVPPLPPKKRSVSTTLDESEKAQLHNPRPVPRLRKRLNPSSNASSQGSMKSNSASLALQTQQEENSQQFDSSGSVQPENLTCSEQHTSEVAPELPPRPIFLKSVFIDREEKESLLVQEENTPVLPPKKGKQGKQGNFTSPEKEHAQHEVKEIYAGDDIPPPLPPRGESHELAYLVVDVSDWKNIEDKCGAYTEVKDDGQIFDKDGVFLDHTYDERQIHHQLTQGPRPALLQQNKLLDDKTSDDENHYEEMESVLPMSPRDFSSQKKEEKNEKKEVMIPPRHFLGTDSSSSGSRAAKCSSKVCDVMLRPNEWISSRRDHEDDFVDFKDIDHFFKVMKQLNAARAEVEHLTKRVLQRQDPEGRTQPLPNNAESHKSGRSGGPASKSKCADTNSAKDENENCLVSTTSTKTFKMSERNAENEPGVQVNFVKRVGERKPHSSHAPANIAPAKEIPVPKKCETDEAIVTASDDEDDYEECFEIKYINQVISVENNSGYHDNAGQEE